MAITRSIAIANRSTVLSDQQVQDALPAMQHQANYHFAPFWHSGARLHFTDAPDSIPKGMDRIEIIDDSDMQGALGYHDLTQDGTPEALIFAATDKQYGLSWTVTFTHELLELLADAWINQAAQFDDKKFWAVEVCDAVEADESGYEITYGSLPPVLCTDFILPKWLIPGSSTNKFDYKGHCSGPGDILSGGYMSIYDVSKGGWTQVQNFDGEMRDVTKKSLDWKRPRPSQELRWEYAKWKKEQSK